MATGPLQLDDWLSGCIGKQSIVGVVVGNCFAELVSLASVHPQDAPRLLREALQLLESPETRSKSGYRPIGFIRESSEAGEPHAYVQKLGTHYVVVVSFTDMDCLEGVRLVTKGVLRKFEQAGAARPS